MLAESVTKTFLAAHRAQPDIKTLLVDDDVLAAFKNESGVLRLGKTKFQSSELWALRGEGMLKLIVLSAPRSAKELFQVLVLSERLVVSGGAILIAPRATDLATETRIEATEMFCGAYPEWDRRLIDGFVVELRKKVVDVFRDEPAVVKGDGAGVDAWRVAELSTAKACKKKVISLSIFNDYRDLGEHWSRLPEMVAVWLEAHRFLFPGYDLWIYHDEAIYSSNAGDDLHQFARQGWVKLFYVPSRSGQGKTERMLHRLLPLWNGDVDYVFCRDLDSLPTWRDRVASEEFVASGCVAGVIHDSSAHIGMLGGLCHFDAKQFREQVIQGKSFDAFIAASGFDDKKWQVHGSDQEYLNQIVAKLPTVLEHQLFKVYGEDGKTRLLRPGSWPHAVVRTELQEPSEQVKASVPGRIQEDSGSLTNYCGAAGWRLDDSLSFYQVVLSKNRYKEGYVVLASDLNPDYSFYAPLASLFWMKRGYQPLVFLVGTASEWLARAQARGALEYARELGAQIHFVPEVEGVRTSTVAQVVRCVAAALPHLRDEDYIITSDIDMFTFGPWAGGNRDREKQFGIYYANAYSQAEYPHWPMSYLFSQVRTWREIVGCVPGQLRESLLAALRDAPNDQDGAWNYDERFMGRKISEWKGYPDQVQFINRDFVKGEWRLDRSGWDAGWAHLNGSLDGVADAHLVRPGFNSENWPRIRALLEAVFSVDELKRADAYRKAWCDAE